MRRQKENERVEEVEQAVADQFAGTAERGDVPWEQVGAGRYMPRRIRGSYKGRTLG